MTSLFPKQLKILVREYIESAPIGTPFYAVDVYSYCHSRYRHTRSAQSISMYIRSLPNIEIVETDHNLYARVS